MTGPNTKNSLTIAAAPFDADAEIAAFRKKYENAGAIVTFLGQVRPQGASGRLKSLRLEHYPEFTEKTIAEYSERAFERWPILGLRIIHRIGDIAPGEAIVFVAAAADHRRAAFEAVDYLMDYLKSEAPLWKQEVTDAGAHWIEPHQDDYADKARWTGAANNSGEPNARD